jgi:AcrR family transcriptional regulator
LQIKKDEVRLAILKEAEKEFLEKGFKDASVRAVAKAAGTTIGNFYNYFESKEALFEELVEDEYQSFMFLIAHHGNAGKQEFSIEFTDVVKMREELILLIQNIMPVFTDHFRILIEGSTGTKYENTREKLLGILEEHFAEHITEFGQSRVHKSMGRVISIQIITGLLQILRDSKDAEVREEMLAEHLLYHIIGTMGLLGLLK